LTVIPKYQTYNQFIKLLIYNMKLNVTNTQDADTHEKAFYIVKNLIWNQSSDQDLLFSDNRNPVIVFDNGNAIISDNAPALSRSIRVGHAISDIKVLKEDFAEDFCPETIYIFTRTIVKYAMTQRIDDSKILGVLSNLPFYKPIKKLEDRRKFAEQMIRKITEMFVSKCDVPNFPKSLPTLHKRSNNENNNENDSRSHNINNTTFPKMRKLNDDITSKPKIKVKKICEGLSSNKSGLRISDIETNYESQLTLEQISTKIVLVPESKYKNKWYKMGLKYGQSHPNIWHQRTIISKDMESDQQKNMRGTFILKTSNSSKANYFEHVDKKSLILSNSFLMMQENKGLPIYFAFINCFEF